MSLGCLAPAQPPASTLQLTTHDTANRVGSTLLTCEPTGGTHPHRDKACAVLTGVDGDFSRINARHQACTLIYAPVDVTAIGTWHGKPVTYKTTYANRCEADRDSDGVFAF
ncbi:SSI family serine proteinase inhibitor [Amycolatopsis sp. CA-128772]|uniref:SSI family serine proteinase inhibitor n=1 Tax=Amycolatopsis sp. CA-128772 TaxID=2073159 RepID=UPI0018EB6867|nr:SSI family serine proteinase inhibitor [Amycolatopsis sp. CA-128772]